MRRLRILVAATALFSMSQAEAAPPIDLPLPAGAVATDSRTEDPGSALIAGAPWKAGAVAGTMAEGRISIGSWRVPIGSHTTLALLLPYREALSQASFTLLLDCTTQACGGFDFRFAIPVLPEPAMHVDLGDFRYLSARREGAGGIELVSVLVSRSNESGFVQIVTATPSAVAPVAVIPSGTVAPPPPPPSALVPDDGRNADTAGPGPSTIVAPESATSGDTATGDPGARLLAEGHAALDDLVFASGSADLAAGEFASLAALAGWLGRNPDARVTLVGHTDAQGNLAANIALSKRRAESVRARLAEMPGDLASRISAEGAGYLAPRASNLSDEGRQKNRRVEVILTPTR